MRYHDILDIYVTATPEQIEEAYAEKLATLNDSEAAPSLKQRKEAELNKARIYCLDYCNKRFGEKCSMEIVEMGRTALEPNRMNDCCADCNNWCLSCCSCACYGTIFAVVVGIISSVASKAAAKKRAEMEAIRRATEEAEAMKRGEELNALINQKNKTVDQCNNKKSTLAAELSHRQAQLQAQIKIFEEKRQEIIEFCNSIGMQLSELQISSSPAVTAMKREVVALEEEVFKANRAISENEALISSSMNEAERARNELRNNRVR